MCGFAGILTKYSLSSDQWQKNLIAMGEAIRYRGPDDQGIWFVEQDGIGLVHQRLSIMDISTAGHQPMVSANEKLVIAYNGEIYNAPILRKELEAEGVQFKSHCDTEVLLEACANWGLKETLSKITGMFAFALWNRENKTLSLARDHTGMKPLYYGLTRSGFLFASELHSFRAWPEFSAEVNRDAIALLMRHNYITAPYTIYEGVYKLMPGTFLENISHESAEFHPQAYWDAKDETLKYKSDPFTGTYEEAVDTLEQKLLSVTERHMLSDVPLGCFLSGGIDSSVVSACASRLLNKPLQTFSIGFEDEAYNEAKYAREVADHLKTDHYEKILSAKDMLDAIPTIMQGVDEPFSDSSQIATWFVSKMTREHVTVALSGDGGDELFCGYNRYVWAQKLWNYIQKLPFVMRRGLSGVIKSMSPGAWNSLHGVGKAFLPSQYHHWHFGQKLHRFADSIMSKDSHELYRLLISHLKHAEQVVQGAKPLSTSIHRKDLWDISEDLPEKMMLLDLLTYLPDDILTKVDRASMLVSLESRVPLLDPEIIHFAMSLPFNYKMENMVSKRVLRDVLYRYVPRELIDRPKMGFAIPIDQWLRGPLKNWATDLLASERLKREGIFIDEEIQKRWKAHQSGKADWSYFLWNVIVFQCWSDSAG